MGDRIEWDSMGEVSVPETALFGAQTQRALDNFGLHSRPVPAEFIRCLALVKAAAALANRDCGALDEETSHALVLAAKRVADCPQRSGFDQRPL